MFLMLYAGKTGNATGSNVFLQISSFAGEQILYILHKNGYDFKEQTSGRINFVLCGA
jgi:hypothetical protein